MIIDVGGGTKPTGVNLDPVHGEGEWRRRAQETPWPCADGEVDGIVARHVLEHIPAGADRIAVFNEAYRVLKCGGEFEIAVPLVGHTGGRPTKAGWQAWADPTHVSYWWFPESLYYFTGKISPNADYGIKRWQLSTWKISGNGTEGRAVLIKP